MRKYIAYFYLLVNIYKIPMSLAWWHYYGLLVVSRVYSGVTYALTGVLTPPSLLVQLSTNVQKWMNQVIGEPDPRNLNLVFVEDGPMATIVTIVTFLSVVKFWGPIYMKDKKAYNLTRVIQVINILQIVVNAYIVKEIVMNLEMSSETWCIKMNTESEGKGLNMARAMYVYYIMKFVDMVDSIMFVLRKKSNQLSFLHVFHHVTTLVLAYVAVTYNPGGPSAVIQMMNAIVHVIMYFYYFLSSLGPKMQKYLWWKNYLTKMQICQFVGIMVFYVDQIYRKKCDDRAKFMTYIGAPIIIVNLILFLSFYIKSYTRKPEAINLQTRTKMNLEAKSR